jgi:hypothetical protein
LTVLEGDTYVYDVSASDPDPGDVLTITAPVLPSWLALSSFGSGVSQLSGVPNDAEVGEHIVELLVTDSHGLTDTQSFTLTVVGMVGRVEGLLFDDLNSNGSRDGGEPGIAGATVSLSPTVESAVSIVAQQDTLTTTTTAAGIYQFSNVPTGAYILSFDLPGEQPNPPSIPLRVLNSTLTVVLPVVVLPTSFGFYLPTIKTQDKISTR